jgi:hypothetical protein
MRNGTKIGLGLIGLAWLTASTAISVHFVAKAQNEGRIHIQFTEPRMYRGSVPAGARSQGGLWVSTPAGASRLPGGQAAAKV